MRKIQLLFLVMYCSQIIANNITFHSGTFESAKSQAALEGKMVLLDFYASWCSPCLWMEETTFSDPGIVSKINEDFVALKVNVDDFDGFALKDHFEVKTLPTILIFTSNGTMLERIEETLSPSKMHVVLDRSLKAKRPRKNLPNSSPQKTIKEATPAHKTSYNIKTSKSSYKLQLALFESYENTLNFFNSVGKKLDKSIVISHDLKGDNVVYRVLVGNFSSTKDANAYKRRILEEYGIKSHLHL